MSILTTLSLFLLLWQSFLGRDEAQEFNKSFFPRMWLSGDLKKEVNNQTQADSQYSSLPVFSSHPYDLNSCQTIQFALVMSRGV